MGTVHGGFSVPGTSGINGPFRALGLAFRVGPGRLRRSPGRGGASVRPLSPGGPYAPRRPPPRPHRGRLLPRPQPRPRPRDRLPRRRGPRPLPPPARPLPRPLRLLPVLLLPNGGLGDSSGRFL